MDLTHFITDVVLPYVVYSLVAVLVYVMKTIVTKVQSTMTRDEIREFVADKLEGPTAQRTLNHAQIVEARNEIHALRARMDEDQKFLRNKLDEIEILMIRCASHKHNKSNGSSDNE